jgi:hypothetical protein
MTDLNNALSPDQELDLSGEGLQRTRASFEITDTELNPAKSGQGTVLHISFEATEPVDEIEGFRADAYMVVRHVKKAVQKGGMGQLKRLFIAVFGTPAGSIDGLKGRFVSAEVWEDEDGFRRIGRFQPVAGAEEGAEAELATAGAVSVSL